MLFLFGLFKVYLIFSLNISFFIDFPKPFLTLQIDRYLTDLIVGPLADEAQSQVYIGQNGINTEFCSLIEVDLCLPASVHIDAVWTSELRLRV